MFNSKKLKDREPQRQLNRSYLSKRVCSYLGTEQRADDDPFLTSHRDENEHEVDNDCDIAIMRKYPRNSLGRISLLSDGTRIAVSDQVEHQRASERDMARRELDPESLMSSDIMRNKVKVNNDCGPTISTEISLDDAGRMVDCNRCMVSDRVRNRHHVDNDPEMAFPTVYYANPLGEVRGAADVDRFAATEWAGNEHQMGINIEPIVSSDRLCKCNLNSLDFAGEGSEPAVSIDFLYKPNLNNLNRLDYAGNGTEAAVSNDFFLYKPNLNRLDYASNGTEAAVSTLYKPNLNRLDYAGKQIKGTDDSLAQPHFESTAFYLREQRSHEDRSGTPTISASDMPFCGLHHSSDSVHECPRCRGNAFCSFENRSPPFHAEFGGVNRCLDTTTDSESCVSFPTPSDDEGYPFMIATPFSGPGYSENKGVDYSDHEGYRGSSFTESPLRGVEYFNLGLHSSRHRSSSVFSRLTFPAKAHSEDDDTPVNFDGHNVEISVDKFKDMVRNHRGFGHQNDYEDFRNKKPQPICYEMEKNQGRSLSIGESNCAGDKGEPTVHFKRRRERGKNKDEIRTGMPVEGSLSNGLSFPQQKRRKLVRPDFSKNEPSHEMGFVVEVSSNLQLSSQDSTFYKDNAGSCEALGGNHKKENNMGQQAGLLQATCQIVSEGIPSEAGSGSDSKGGKAETGQCLSLKNDGANGNEGSTVQLSVAHEPITDEAVVNRASQDPCTESCLNPLETSIAQEGLKVEEVQLSVVLGEKHATEEVTDNGLLPEDCITESCSNMEEAKESTREDDINDSEK